MSRPVVVYLVMIVVLVAGLWAVLEIGRHVHAPQDLAGKWELHAAGEGSPVSLMTIEQSGRFFQVHFGDQPALDLKLVDETASSMTLTDKSWHIRMSGAVDGDDKIVDLTGPQPGHWTAHRTVRTFPADPTTKEAP